MNFPIAFHPIYKHPLPDGHRFPMVKYELLPQQLLLEGTANQTDFFEPSKLCCDIDVLRVHTSEYLKNLKALNLDRKAARKLGFPLNNQLVERELYIAQGTIDGCIKAFEYNIAMNIAGGTHHAYTDHGEAFCLLNDQAIAARYLQHHQLADKILIVDLDVHQGNGTAEIFQNDDSVYTFSMHGAGNYPFKKELSNLDIALPDHTDDSSYLNELHHILPDLIAQEQPDFIFYLCGVDVLETDKLGRLGMTLDGCKKRDEFALSAFAKARTKNNNRIPIQCSMGGGYSPDIKLIIEAHANTYRVARDIFT
ncbi:hone deacetylase/AcuC/AphA family protein [Nonlabens ulvanivorans]|uniref:Hone deacetylase/AcuC/AphA family protein n=1 Tax=Nonlabens ulvanivorans TaxID=906888 RepID=A0A081D7H5_NONUL|nr:histone deacetylase [Nonlabens ulvanivorans]GAK74871.1 hone deacetylase/AcuC/AphA family protein [Nonlabens ulvanivorans]